MNFSQPSCQLSLYRFRLQMLSQQESTAGWQLATSARIPCSARCKSCRGLVTFHFHCSSGNWKFYFKSHDDIVVLQSDKISIQLLIQNPVLYDLFRSSLETGLWSFQNAGLWSRRSLLCSYQLQVFWMILPRGAFIVPATEFLLSSASWRHDMTSSALAFLTEFTSRQKGYDRGIPSADSPMPTFEFRNKNRMFSPLRHLAVFLHWVA